MSENKPEDVCNYYLPIRTESPEKQLAWLKAHKNEICADEVLLKCLVKHHLISEEEYDDAIAAYWGQDTPISTTLPFSTFTGGQSNFDEYFIFSADESTHEITYTLDTFDFNGHNYSIPFFRGVPLKFAAVTGTSNLIFTEAKIDGKAAIVFKIEGIKDAYFDFAHNPPGKP